MFRCGPAAVKAIYEQKVDAQYDVPFVYAEVNGDVHRIIIRNGKVLSKTVDKRSVGALISTKRPGAMRMLDITSEYKTERGKRKKKIDKNVLLKQFSNKNLLLSHLDEIIYRAPGAAGKSL